jgi:predicted amidohydrolase YtcJ
MEVMMRALPFALVLSLAAVTAGAQPAGLVLINGRVYTLDADRPWADGLAIAGDRIAGVGTTAEMRRLAGRGTRIIDLQGAFVSPGFKDAHVHMDATGVERARRPGLLLETPKAVLVPRER